MIIGSHTVRVNFYLSYKTNWFCISLPESSRVLTPPPHVCTFVFLQDVQYADIDHMVGQMDFTVDDARFAGLDTYFKQLQAEGMHIIIILVSLTAFWLV